MISYATAEQFAEWLDDSGADLPDNEAALRRAATIRVALACRRDPYNDSPTITEALILADATCAQAASWAARNADPAKDGTDTTGPLKESKLQSGLLTFDTSVVSKLLEAAADGLCHDAEQILDTSGLLYRPGPMFDDTGHLPSWGTGPRWSYSPFVNPLSGEYDGYSYGEGDGYGELIVIQSAPTTGSSPRAVTADATVSPGDDVWVVAADGQTITLTILHEPAGQHCRIKRYDTSTGTVLLVPQSGLIDGVSSYPLAAMNAVELDSNGTDFAVF